MKGLLQKILVALGKFWGDLSFATANGTVEAVRYQPRRLILASGSRVEGLPDGSRALARRNVSADLDLWLDGLAEGVGRSFGGSAEAWTRWLTGAAGGVIDHVGASAIEDLRFQGGISPRMLEPHAHQVAILFLDMRGFSKLTVAIDDSLYLTEIVGEYLSEMTRIVERHRGIVLQYMGDGLFALFLPELSGMTPQALVEHLAGPVSSELHTAFDSIHARWRAEWASKDRINPRIGLAVGVSFGSATIGLIGPPGKKYFGVVGAPVNLSAYLCSQAAAGTTLIDQATFLSTEASPPKGSRRIRLRSEKLHQRIATIRIRPQPAIDA